MIINDNTTIVDVAFNLTGSLAGIPVLLDQLPAGRRVGFADMPEPWEDVPQGCYAQTWTPDLVGLDVAFNVTIYNVIAQSKAPFSTNLFQINEAIVVGADALEQSMEGDENAAIS